MPRIIFLKPLERMNYFVTLKRISGLTWRELAQKIQISQRHLTDIKKGLFSLPKNISDLIANEYSLNLPESTEVKNDYWYSKKAAKLGGKRRFELYGPLEATYESRRKGGLNSLKVHRQKGTGFILGKKIKIPAKCSRLAEIIGVLLGDGSISNKQVSIYLNATKETEYAFFLKNLIQGLFGVKISIVKRKNDETLVLVISSTKFVSFLTGNKLPIGNKIRQRVDVPWWVWQRKSWIKACLRGFFDTDGCIYVDNHRYKNKTYSHVCLAFSNYSPKLLGSLFKALKDLGYNPTISSKRNILLRRENEVLRFYREIGSHNRSHIEFLDNFLEEYRSGRNGAASKADEDESPTRVRISPPPQQC